MNNPDQERILLVIPRVSNFHGHLINALQYLQYPYTTFDSRDSIVYRNLFVRRLIRRFPFTKFLKRASIARLNRRLLNMVDQYQPTILFAVGAETISAQTIKTIREKGILTLNWFPDLMSHWSVIKKIAPAYDHFFAIDKTIMESLNAEGIKNSSYALLAVSDQGQFQPHKNRRYPITFVGNYNLKFWPKREPMLHTVKDSGLHIWGPAVWQQTSVGSCYQGTTQGEHMLEIFRQSKIALDIPSEFLKANSVGPRVFDVLGAGTALFLYDVKSEVKEIFKEGIECVTFTSEDDLREKVAYYLAHEAELEAIAFQGYQAVQKHTYPQRIQELISRARAATS
ncbi:MAG: glycosyltransferase [Candidatus Yanofskybacteria bacterium]|nr:glycosyltransferase [Candidatus Yanofskybacteria bacterium]